MCGWFGAHTFLGPLLCYLFSRLGALRTRVPLAPKESLGVSEASFHKGAPFLPFQQLLGCLPAASMQFLPAKYQWLMTDPASPLLDFFPADFKVW